MPVFASAVSTSPMLFAPFSTLIVRFEKTLVTTMARSAIQLTGNIEGRLFVVVYTPRHNAIRIISARKANQREVTQYENRSNDD